ncbi:hypothetical protein AB1Y20_001494 [Prymnesium parvum]|uniref:Uncharacterized protein n=1 Tax=Prymnesium parvum TaxID=97485 RepID=A0AB34K7W1_PRYPA
MVGCPAEGSVTMRGREDGFGAQYAAMISTYSWAIRHGLTYCVTPWRRMEHHANASALFEFVGGHRFGPAATDSTAAVTEKHAELAREPLRNGSAWHRAARAHYYATAKPRLAWRTAGPHLAVHIRRGDVTHRMPGRFVSNGLVAQCVMGVLSRMARKPSVHVFSQGAAADFGSVLKLPRVQLHLNEPLEVTFHHLVSADVLIMAKSTLSDCAAFLSGGRLFEQPSTGGGGQLHYMHRSLEIHAC